MESTTPQLRIEKDDGLSIDELVRRKAMGFSVLRSAHVGNLSPYNLALADAGIPILSVDHNITGVDRNYMPESIATQKSQKSIAALGRLVCRSLAEANALDPSAQDKPQFLDDFHIAAARQALPANAMIMTNTEYLRTNELVVREIVELALKEFPSIFNRLALPDGSTKKSTNASSLVKLYGIMQLNDNPREENEAVIMPNILDILANFVIESLETEQDVQYHLSGPAMVKYIDSMMPDLQELYSKLRDRASFGPRLPAKLTVKLVPTAEAKFATTLSRRSNLDSLLEAVKAADEELDVLQGARKAFFTSPGAQDSAARREATNQFKDGEAAIDLVVAEKISQIPELLVEPGTSGFITQYDVLDEGGLYVPAINRQASMAELARLSARLGRIQRRFTA
jgi:hypothetical protein